MTYQWTHTREKKKSPRSVVVLGVTLAFCLFLPHTAMAQASEELPTVNWLFLGDTSFGENYQDVRAVRGEENVLEVHGYDYLIEAFREILGDATFVVANLETPITDQPISPLRGRKLLIHYADVNKTPQTLRKYHFDLVSLANNHALDFGMPGLRQTVRLLDEQGIRSCGAGETEREARSPYVQEIAVGTTTVRMAVICAFEFEPRYAQSYSFYAEGQIGGVNSLIEDPISEDIRSLRHEYEDIFIVVFPHWGVNYQSATSEQRLLGRAIIDAGADLVIGHGAHTLQELEYYNGRWIVYGIGNFVFAAPGRYDLRQAPPYSLVANLRIGTENGALSKKLRLYPIFSDNLASHYRNRFVSDDEFEEIKTMLRRHSAIPPGFDAMVSGGRDRYGHYLEFRLSQ